MVIIRGEALQLQHWRCALNQGFYPHHIILFLDETATILAPTLQRKLGAEVCAWVCTGVVCSQSISDIPTLLSQL